MQYFAISPKGRVLGVANYVDEVAEFVDRITKGRGRTTWSATGQQMEIPTGKPTGWVIRKRNEAAEA